MDQRDFLTPREAAKVTHTSHMSVHRWLRAGLLAAYATPGGYQRIFKRDLAAFLRAQGMPVPREVLSRVRILVVDDGALVLEGLATGLARSRLEADVVACGNGTDALIRLGTDLPDVLLLDAYMPGANGLDVLRAVKANPATKDVLVVGMSGRGGELRDAFLAAGLAAFLEKPMRLEDLVSTVELLLNRRAARRRAGPTPG